MTADLTPSNHPTNAILESISDGVFTVDANWQITSFNRAAEAITGVTKEQAIGQRCCDVFRSSMCAEDCALRKTLSSGEPIIGRAGYIIDAEGQRIPISVSTAVLRDAEGQVTGGAETFRDLSELEALRREVTGRIEMGDLVSHSPAMQQALDMLPVIAESPSTVVIHGETGTGKEVVARALHTMSAQGKGPFVAVNCGALPDALLESELFGHLRGAFTGATHDKPGRFELAEDGTLFLDEIGEISPALQVRLLRVLQEHTYEPLGSTQTHVTNARVIVATHRDLKARMQSGEFREDLYYRIHVISIDLPPLRNRKEDIPLLAEHFIARFNRRRGRTLSGISSEALSLLMAHDWPGNVRELENAIEHAFIVCREGEISIEHLPVHLAARRKDFRGADTIADAHNLLDLQTIQAALERNGNNRAATARELGIHKTTLFRKMKRLGILAP